MFLGGCGVSILTPIKNITSLPSDRDVILNLTEVNKQQGWYLVNPTDWKMLKWEFPNSIPSALNEETRKSYLSWSPQTQRLLYAKKSISPNGSIAVLKIEDKLAAVISTPCHQMGELSLIQTALLTKPLALSKIFTCSILPVTFHGVLQLNSLLVVFTNWFGHQTAKPLPSGTATRRKH